MNYDEIEGSTVKIVEGSAAYELSETALMMGMGTQIADVLDEEGNPKSVSPTRLHNYDNLNDLDPTELRAAILARASNQFEGAYRQLREAVNTLAVVDIRAHDKYAPLLKGAGKAVNEVSERM